MKVNFKFLYFTEDGSKTPGVYAVDSSRERGMPSLKLMARNAWVTRPPGWHLAQTEQRCMRAFKIVGVMLQAVLIVVASWNSGVMTEDHSMDLYHEPEVSFIGIADRVPELCWCFCYCIVVVGC